jgi:uncharacterized RDD family membrane protein YckC
MNVTERRQRAGLVSRVVADLIDALIVCVATATMVVVASMLRALFVGSALALPQLRAVATVGGLSFVYVGYLTFFWTATGRTPGKQATGLRVVTSHGGKLTLWRSVVRAVLCILLPIGLLWVLFSRRNRAVHDVVARTAVVYDWSGRGLRDRVGLTPAPS